nr:unnamed protein product [Callosobruchus analis]CAI5840242.1 unnamed protein product [Callosobruchus analis]
MICNNLFTQQITILSVYQKHGWAAT